MGGTSTTIEQAPTTPAPSASQSAEDLYKARLQYDPQIAQMEQQLAQQYYPQQASLQAALYQQYAPLMAQTQQQLRQQYAPSQTALTEAFTQQAQQRLTSPYGETPEQTQATEAIRQREMDRLSRMIRERSNLGGTLYGGRSQQMESRGLQEMGQQFAAQDIARQQQGAQTALQYSIPVLQQLYPQTTYPGAAPLQQPVGQPVTPSADALYNAYFQAGQPEYFAQPGSPSPAWGLAGATVGAIGVAI